MCFDFLVLLLADDFFFFFLEVDFDAAKHHNDVSTRNMRHRACIHDYPHGRGSISASSSASNGSDSTAGAVFGLSPGWVPVPTSGINPDVSDIQTRLATAVPSPS